MYGLIGRPLGHSFSASFFNDKFQKEGIDEVYELFPLETIQDLPALLQKHPDLKGLNVTIPYKQEVIPFLSSLSEEAEQIGAVNVIKIDNKEGEKILTGFNSDVVGFMESIRPLLNPQMKTALVLGTGGASKAVIFGLKKLGMRIIQVSRKKTEGVMIYDELTPEFVRGIPVIVNTTPLGMWPHIDEAPRIPYEALNSSHLLFDLVYNPAITEFMKRGLRAGAVVKNGLEMLHGQALEAWRIWNN